MKKAILIFAAVLALSQVSMAVERKLYVGSDSSEVTLSFNHFVEISAKKAPAKSKAETVIEEQLQHMFGTMAAHQYKAVPRGDHEVEISSIERKDANTYVAKYSYSGTAVLQNGAGKTYEVILPNNPSKIYEISTVGDHNPCTDEHYNSEGDFWYFWNPDQPGCRLKLDRDYTKVLAKVTRKTNSQQTYPEYERLVDSNGTVKISLLMGMDEPENGKDPNKSSDTNADNFRQIKEALIRIGYKNEKASSEELSAILPEGTKAYVENFTKEITKDGRKIRLLVQIFFGPSGIDEESTAFHYMLKDALENSSIMIYDGHSGLGGHLDLASIEETEGFKIKPNKNRYQIYFFNSCSSYSYYNTMFFERKKTAKDPKGTKNLDILTNGLATYFYVMHDTNLSLIKSVELWASGRNLVSYQTLAKQIDSGNLFGVNGDEDNPKK